MGSCLNLQGPLVPTTVTYCAALTDGLVEHLPWSNLCGWPTPFTGSIFGGWLKRQLPERETKMAA